MFIYFWCYAQVNKGTPYHMAVFYLVNSIGHKALYTNYGINFFLYVISGKKFRSDLGLLINNLLHFLRCKILPEDHSTSHTVESITSSTTS